MVLPRAGVPDEHLLGAYEKQRPPLEEQRKRAVSFAEREPLLAHAHLAVRPGAGKDSLRRARVMLADMEARSRGPPDGDGQRVQRHDDLRDDSGGSNDHSQRLWVPSRSGPNAILPEEASCSSNGRSCVMESPVL